MTGCISEIFTNNLIVQFLCISLDQESNVKFVYFEGNVNHSLFKRLKSPYIFYCGLSLSRIKNSNVIIYYNIIIIGILELLTCPLSQTHDINKIFLSHTVITWAEQKQGTYSTIIDTGTGCGESQQVLCRSYLGMNGCLCFICLEDKFINCDWLML